MTNSVVPPLMGRLIAVHAFSQLMTNPLLAPEVYTLMRRSPPAAGSSWAGSRAQEVGRLGPAQTQRAGYNVGLSIREPEVVKMKGVDRPKRDSPFLATYDSIAAANCAADSREAC